VEEESLLLYLSLRPDTEQPDQPDTGAVIGAISPATGHVLEPGTGLSIDDLSPHTPGLSPTLFRGHGPIHSISGPPGLLSRLPGAATFAPVADPVAVEPRGAAMWSVEPQIPGSGATKGANR